jgi:undecaprenyl diphosphate synthase
MHGYVAFDYSARDESLRAAERYGGGDEAESTSLLDMREPELVIRTSGEQRLSTFLLWQAAYSELACRDDLWADFGRGALQDSVA